LGAISLLPPNFCHFVALAVRDQFAYMLLFFGEVNPPFGDLDGSGACDSADIGYLLLNFGSL